MKLAKIVIVLVALVAWFGFIGPWCVSAPNTELVVGWIFATLAILILAAEWLRRKYFPTNEEENKK